MICPTPSKHAFKSKHTALKGMHWAWRKGRHGKLPTRCYRCPCGKWHLTSKPKKANHT